MLFQDYIAKSEQEVSRLKKEFKTEHEARVKTEDELQTLKETVATLTREKDELAKKLQDTDDVFVKKLKEISDEQEKTEAELNRVKNMINGILRSLVGKLFCQSPISITRVNNKPAFLLA